MISHRFAVWAGMLNKAEKLGFDEKNNLLESPTRPLKYSGRGVIPGC
jgi:hypothetical protein